jgi:putative transposase
MEYNSPVLRTFQYSLKVTRGQARRLNLLLGLLAEIYNAALQERTEAWKRARRSITYYDQTRELTELRAESLEYRTYSVEILREPLRRIDHAFRAFFRRVKAGERPGYPRFRFPDRYNSFAVSRFSRRGP